MLKGKTAVVTGGSRGIGKAISIAFAQQGANVAIVYAGNDQAAKITEAEIKALGCECRIYKCNVADMTECEATVKAVIEEFGKIDILVNNAGITRDKLVLQMNEDDFDDVLDINLKGAFNMIKQCYRTFMKNRAGKIINLTSVSGLMGNAGQANYSASKAGIIGLTKSIAKELAGRNICCNAIAPGFVETDMTESFKENQNILEAIPLKRMGKPEEVAALAVFLAQADYVTGEVIRIDGGLAM